MALRIRAESTTNYPAFLEKLGSSRNKLRIEGSAMHLLLGAGVHALGSWIVPDTSYLYTTYRNSIFRL